MSTDQGTFGTRDWSAPSTNPGWESSDPKASYDFNIFGVWIVNGQAYYGTDSGCSCPMPWEDVNSVNDLDQGTYLQVFEAYEKYINEYVYDGEPHPEHTVGRVKLAQWLTENGI